MVFDRPNSRTLNTRDFLGLARKKEKGKKRRTPGILRTFKKGGVPEETKRMESPKRKA